MTPNPPSFLYNTGGMPRGGTAMLHMPIKSPGGQDKWPALLHKSRTFIPPHNHHRSSFSALTDA